MTEGVWVNTLPDLSVRVPVVAVYTYRCVRRGGYFMWRISVSPMPLQVPLIEEELPYRVMMS